MTPGDIEITPAGHAVLAGDPCLSTWVREQGRLDCDGLCRHICANLLRVGDSVVDVGTYIGAYAASFARRIGPLGRLVCFEPNLCARHAALHNLAPFMEQTTIYGYFAGDREGAASLRVDSSNFGASFQVEGGDILVKTLDGLLGGRKVDLIKLDIEGRELDALRGARELIARWRPVLVFEVGHGQQERAGHTVAELLAHVRAAGYRTFNSDMSELTPEKIARIAWDCVALPE